MDRFLMKIIVSYPQKEDELKILDAYSKNIEDINPVMDKEKLLEHQENVRKISVSDEAKKYIVDIVDKLRKQDENIEFGPSPRATIALLNVSKAIAYLK
jgi:MoxR-like ATPase